MKTLQLLCLILISILSACNKDDQRNHIRFCQTLSENRQCGEDKAHFTLGDSVFVTYSFNEAAADTRLIGEILRVEDTTHISLGIRMFEVHAGDTAVSQNIPFHEFGYEAIGSFKVRFMNEAKQTIAERELSVTEN